ncbi:MAG: glucosaminidase domain-containing protein, partial [Terriglobales bacterium]
TDRRSAGDTHMTHPEFIVAAYAQAQASGHIWPAFAACEAAEESAFGESQLAIRANNLFGLKAGRFTHDLPTIAMPTHEWVDGRLIPTTAIWPRFDSWAQAFDVRMEVLRGLAPEFEHYAAALAATDGPTYVREVSKTWSTDPNRAANVLAIHSEFAGCFVEAAAAAQ